MMVSVADILKYGMIDIATDVSKHRNGGQCGSRCLFLVGYSPRSLVLKEGRFVEKDIPLTVLSRGGPRSGGYGVPVYRISLACLESSVCLATVHF